MPDTSDRPDVDAIVAQLRARVAERRAAGVYPADLEDDLAAHFRRIAEHRIDPNVNEVKAALAELETRLDFTMEKIPVESGMPGGERLHRALAKMQARQIEGVLHQVWLFADATREVLTALTRAVEDPHSHVHPDLLGQIDAALERLTTLDRSPGADVADLRRRVEALEGAEVRRRVRPAFSWASYLQTFPPVPASPELVAAVEGHEPVLVLGAGRGDLVRQLGERNVSGSGVEEAEELVDMAQLDGLAVEHGDPVYALAAVADRSLGAVASVHFLEQLSVTDLGGVVGLAAEKLAPGGVLACEVFEPAALATVVSPVPLHAIPVEYLTFLLRDAGFTSVERLTGGPAGYAVVATR